MTVKDDPKEEQERKEIVSYISAQIKKSAPLSKKLSEEFVAFMNREGLNNTRHDSLTAYIIIRLNQLSWRQIVVNEFEFNEASVQLIDNITNNISEKLYKEIKEK